MATTTEKLDADGLAEVAWDACDGPLAGRLVASPQDARGRGMLLRVTRGGKPLDLSGDGIRLYLLWRHRQTHARGCEPMEATGAAEGAFRVFWPAAMCAAEGTAECEVVLSWGERALATPAFDVEVGTSLVGALAVRDGFTLFVEAIKRYEGAAADALAVAAELRTARDAGELSGKDGPAGPKGDAGAAGRDGVSCTHSWEGSVLTVTSASGTSSADLRGPKGDAGATGPEGPAGATGPKGDPFTYADFTQVQLRRSWGPRASGARRGRRAPRALRGRRVPGARPGRRAWRDRRAPTAGTARTRRSPTSPPPWTPRRARPRSPSRSAGPLPPGRSRSRSPGSRASAARQGLPAPRALGAPTERPRTSPRTPRRSGSPRSSRTSRG